MMASELEVTRGYVDLALILRHDARQYQALELLLEFKYVGLKKLGLNGEQVQALTADQLAAAEQLDFDLIELAVAVPRLNIDDAELSAEELPGIVGVKDVLIPAVTTAGEN